MIKNYLFNNVTPNKLDLRMGLRTQYIDQLKGLPGQNSIPKISIKSRVYLLKVLGVIAGKSWAAEASLGFIGETISPNP